MYVDGHGSDLNGLLSANIFKVPEYQRAYAWRASYEVKDFWNDFLNMLSANMDKYFMGTMLFAGVEGEPNVRMVIDGQQRMATFMIFLAAMRDVLVARTDLPEDVRAGKKRLIETLLLPFDGEREWTRLVLSGHDQDQFEAILRARPETPHPSRNVKAAYVYLKRELKARVDAQGGEALLTMLTRLLTTLVVVRIESPTTLDAHIVFEAVNDRGLPLTAAERMKNYVLSRASFAGMFAEIHTSWVDMENRVGRSNGALDSFLLYQWNSTHHPKVQKDRLYRDFKEEVKQYNVAVRMQELSLESEVYEQLLKPTQAFWRSAKVVKLLTEIGALGVKQVYILLLALGRMSVDGALSPEDFADTLKFLLDFSFRYSSIAGLQTNVLEKAYSDLATKVRADVANLPLVFSDLTDIVPSDTVIRDILVDGGRTLATPINKYILFKIAELELATKEITLAQEEHHLEHIIPQSPDEIYADDLEARGIDHAGVVSRLGNLTVILGEWNQQMSNRQFADKRPTYALSVVTMNEELAALEDFGNEELIGRQSVIVEKLIVLWPALTPERFALEEVALAD